MNKLKIQYLRAKCQIRMIFYDEKKVSQRIEKIKKERVVSFLKNRIMLDKPHIPNKPLIENACC